MTKHSSRICNDEVSVYVFCVLVLYDVVRFSSVISFPFVIPLSNSFKYQNQINRRQRDSFRSSMTYCQDFFLLSFTIRHFCDNRTQNWLVFHTVDGKNVVVLSRTTARVSRFVFLYSNHSYPQRWIHEAYRFVQYEKSFAVGCQYSSLIYRTELVDRYSISCDSWFPGKRWRTWRTSESRIDLLTKIGSVMWRLSLDSWTEYSRGRRHHDALPMSECFGCQVTGRGVITEAILLLHELWTPRRRTMSQIWSKGNMTSEESSGLHYWFDKEQTDRVAVKTQKSQADDILRRRDACIAEVRPEVKRIGALPSIRCHGRDGEVSPLRTYTDFFVAVRFGADLDGRLQLL